VRLEGRILYLTEDPAFVRAQLAGANPAWSPANKLRDDISTDEITPAYICYYYDETLGEFPYLGLKCRDEFPITRGSVKGGGFVVAVSGKRRGKGSSREQSPYAEMCAGIKLVVAESIERIYRENCQNLGRADDDRLLDPRQSPPRRRHPAVRVHSRRRRNHARIIEHGGLFITTWRVSRADVVLHPPETPRRPMTLGEKILARQWVVDPARG